MNFHPIEKPTEPGWWWYFHSNVMQIQRVHRNEQGKLRCTQGWLMHEWPLTDMPGKWYGPKIPEPDIKPDLYPSHLADKAHEINEMAKQVVHRGKVEMKAADPSAPRRFKFKALAYWDDRAGTTGYGVYIPGKREPYIFPEMRWSEDGLMPVAQNSPEYFEIEWLDPPVEEKKDDDYLLSLKLTRVGFTHLRWKDKRNNILDIESTLIDAGLGELIPKLRAAVPLE